MIIVISGWSWVWPALAALLTGLLGADEPKAPTAPRAPGGHPDQGRRRRRLALRLHEWKHFTVADGLPNDHIFAVKADGPKVWIGTEDGLACSTSGRARSGAGRRRTACRSRR